MGGEFQEGYNYLSAFTVKSKKKDWKQELGIIRSNWTRFYFIPIISKVLCLCFKEQGGRKIPALDPIDLEVRLGQINI